MKNGPKSPTKPSGTLSEILFLSPEELRAFPNNPRTHDERQLAALMASMQRYGATVPIIIDEENNILAGHGRWEAAKRLALATVPVRRLCGLTPAEKLGYILADNKLAELSAWDEDLLKSNLEILLEDNFEVELTGFSTAEIDVMLDTESKAATAADPGDLQAGDLAVAILSRPGDLWQLGEHRLLCGDARNPDDYARLMRGDPAQMVFTDPPYNVAVDGHVGGLGKIKHREFAMASGEMSRAQFIAFLKEVLTRMRDACGEGAILYVCMDWRHLYELFEAAQEVFGDAKQLIAWVKANAGMGSFYRSGHEMVVVFKRGDAPHINNFQLGQYGRYRSNVWQYQGVSGFGKDRPLLALHPTVKPVAMVADAMRDCSTHHGIILDPFCGSGTVLVAAERTGRIARAMELDAHYVDVAIGRWMRVTGKQAVLAETGQTWSEVMASRQTEAEAPGQAEAPPSATEPDVDPSPAALAKEE